jgi:hypothetical protein
MNDTPRLPEGIKLGRLVISPDYVRLKQQTGAAQGYADAKGCRGKQKENQ